MSPGPDSAMSAGGLFTGDATASDTVAARARIELERTLFHLLLEELGPEIDPAALPGDAIRVRVAGMLEDLLSREGVPLSANDRHQVVGDVVDVLFGYGPIRSLMQDPEVTGIMVDDCNTILAESRGRLTQTGRRFLDEQHLSRVISRLAEEAGCCVSEVTPIMDGRLPDGSRISAVLRPVAVDGPMLMIRKAAANPLSVEDLLAAGTLDERFVQFLQVCVQGRVNTLITGAAGSGKTTLLNIATRFFDDDERIVTVEERAELKLHQSHVLRMESHPVRRDGGSSVRLRELIHSSLRMRPDRIIVGDLRDGEILDLLYASNIGYDGLLATLSAHSPRDALSRIERLADAAGRDVASRAVRQEIASAFDVLIHLEGRRGGVRRVARVCEVSGTDDEEILLRDVFVLDAPTHAGAPGVVPRLKSTGLRPQFAKRLEDRGYPFPPGMFRYET